MKYHELTEEDRKLVEAAEKLIKKRRSKRSGVAAALRTKTGRTFLGVNIEIEASAPCSICAEYAAIGTMVTEGEDEIEAIVAVNRKPNGHHALPPCGKCRQFISEFGNPYVILELNGGLKKVRLSGLYPAPVVSE